MIKIILILLLAIPLPAVEINALIGFSPSSPHLFGNAKIKDLVIFGADVSTGKTLQYVASFSFMEVPGNHVQNYGVTPVGGRLNFFPHWRIHPFLLTDEGIVASTRPIPIPKQNATGLNFMVDFGTGVKIGRLGVGYKFQHISNAGTTRYNPGLDNNVFFVSYKVYGRPR